MKKNGLFVVSGIMLMALLVGCSQPADNGPVPGSANGSAAFAGSGFQCGACAARHHLH